MDGGLAEVGHRVLADAAAVLPGLAHVVGYAQHAEVTELVHHVGGLARQQQPAVRQVQQSRERTQNGLPNLTVHSSPCTPDPGIGAR